MATIGYPQLPFFCQMLEVKVRVEGVMIPKLSLFNQVRSRHGGKCHCQVVPDVLSVWIERQRLSNVQTEANN